MLLEILSLLGRPQREPQGSHREKSKEERDGEAGEVRRQYGESTERALLLRCALGRLTVEERVGLFSCNSVALRTVRLQP